MSRSGSSPSSPDDESDKKKPSLREYCIGYWHGKPTPGQPPKDYRKPCGICYGLSLVVAENRQAPEADEVSALRGVRVMMLQQTRPVAEAANDQHYQRQQPSSQASPSTDIVPPQPNRQSALLERAIRTTERIQHTVHHLDEVPGHVRDGLQATGAMLTKQLESMRTVIAKTATRKTLDGAVALGGQTIAQVQRMATWVKDKLVPES
eukprot:TRINITY_DN7491_c1_g1_i3.p1 TRINITY_DN7491_c1_g1~~TRINITY_DN7491_c1_g1_i3.p1  ORF type:complete len:207 (+),score=54.58 TRINITY_DN7491_c1_g1_i3:102-722(+)